MAGGQAVPFFSYSAIQIPTLAQRQAAIENGEPDPLQQALEQLNEMSATGRAGQILIVGDTVICGKVEGYMVVEPVIAHPGLVPVAGNTRKG